jgi:hypothetical protein
MTGISQYSAENIILLEKAVTKHFGISRGEMRIPGTRGSAARQVMYYLLNKHFLYSSVQIGRIYNKDHTTILYGIKKIRLNKASSDKADDIFKECLWMKGNSVDKDVGITLNNVCTTLPHDEGMPGYPTISIPKSNKNVDKNNHTR